MSKIFEGLDSVQIAHAITGYAVILTKMLDEGYDPLVDTDVLAFIEADEKFCESDEANQQAISDFYEIYDALLTA